MLRIGRELDNEVVLVDPRASRYHAGCAQRGRANKDGTAPTERSSATRLSGSLVELAEGDDQQRKPACFEKSSVGAINRAMSPSEAAAASVRLAAVPTITLQPRHRSRPSRRG
jgi:hypothetical protein